MSRTIFSSEQQIILEIYELPLSKGTPTTEDQRPALMWAWYNTRPNKLVLVSNKNSHLRLANYLGFLYWTNELHSEVGDKSNPTFSSPWTTFSFCQVYYVLPCFQVSHRMSSFVVLYEGKVRKGALRRNRTNPVCKPHSNTTKPIFKFHGNCGLATPQTRSPGLLALPYYVYHMCSHGPRARSHLHSARVRLSHVFFHVRSFCLHPRGNSSLLGTNLTTPGHLSHK